MKKTTIWTRRFVLVALCVLGSIFWGASCQISNSDGQAHSKSETRETPTQPKTLQKTVWNKSEQLPKSAKGGASKAFWQMWGDGRAELSGYKGVTMRYGIAREAVGALIYVAEPMDRRTWIKNDRVQGPNKVSTLKLNHVLKFRTGIYPYSIMTSVFSPIDQWRKERFSPVKITFTGQEWCGHVFQAIWPAADRYRAQVRSYFASEGETDTIVKTKGETLYEDALWLQLRELDGAFAGGKSWKGSIVPTTWSVRKAHVKQRPTIAEIARSDAKWDGKDVTKFEVKYNGFVRTFYVEKASPRRILRWTSSIGEDMRLQKTARLPYWGLSGKGDEAALKKIGL